MTDKKVLIVAYTFPPSGGAGVQRTTKFVKYLSIFNWEPIILTGRQTVRLKDYGLLDDISPDVKVIKTFNLTPNETLKQSKGFGYFYRLLDWLSVPDLAIWWLPFAVWAGIDILRQHQVKAIYATGGPFSTLLVGVILKKIFKLPLILDFRDPWTLNPYRFPRKWYVFWRDIIEQILEAYCLRNADKLLSVHKHYVQLFAARYGPEIMSKFSVITNGFDSQEMQSANLKDEFANLDFANKINLIYIGTTNSYRTATTFLEGVKILLQRRSDFRTRLQCLFVGDNHQVHQPELNGVVYWHKYVNYSQAMSLMDAADILLLLTGGSVHEMPGKTYEYIATGKPILALAPIDGAIAEVLREVNLGTLVSPNNPEDVADGLEALMEEILACVNRKPDWDRIAQYSRRSITGQLAAVLDELAV